jgi:2,3-bisphosphoglycerate-independent phosphoglycerate mutase
LLHKKNYHNMLRERDILTQLLRFPCRGRGAFESLGAGMDMEPGDIAFKSNFAVVDEQTGVVVRRRADRAFEREGPILCDALNGLVVEVDEIRYRVYCRYATEHRCGVVVRPEAGAGGLSDQIEGTDPLKDGLVLRTSVAWSVEDDSPAGIAEREKRERTARVVNAVSEKMREVLRVHPLNLERRQDGKPEANVVLLRGCGSLLELASFEEMHGMRACMVAPTKIIAGLGKSVGMDVLEVGGATGDYRSDFRNKALHMVRALCGGESGAGSEDAADFDRVDSSSTYDFGFLHIKAVDDASHDRDVALKVACLEVVDAMMGQLIKALRDAGATDTVVGITGDHSTPAEFGDHSHEPVPIAISTVQNIAESISDGVLDAISTEALPPPQDLLGMSSDTRIDNFFSWKRPLIASQNEEKGVEGRIVANQDGVRAFCELDSAKGCLGRFPGNLIVQCMKAFF